LLALDQEGALRYPRTGAQSGTRERFAWSRAPSLRKPMLIYFPFRAGFRSFRRVLRSKHSWSRPARAVIIPSNYSLQRASKGASPSEAGERETASGPRTPASRRRSRNCSRTGTLPGRRRGCGRWWRAEMRWFGCADLVCAAIFKPKDAKES
jgi:hypothetical protein